MRTWISHTTCKWLNWFRFFVFTEQDFRSGCDKCYHEMKHSSILLLNRVRTLCQRLKGMLVYDSLQSRYQLKAPNRESIISLKIKKDATPVKFKWYAVWKQIRRHNATERRSPCKLTGNYWTGQRCHMAQITAENGLPIILDSSYLKRRLWCTRINLLQRMKNSRSFHRTHYLSGAYVTHGWIQC